MTNIEDNTFLKERDMLSPYINSVVPYYVSVAPLIVIVVPHAVKPSSDLDQQLMRPSTWLWYHVGIYRVSSLDKKPKVTAHKQITNHYTNIITWLKPSKRKTVHGLSQSGHFRQFINIKRKITYVSLINGYGTNDPPCSLNRYHGPIGC